MHGDVLIDLLSRVASLQVEPILLFLVKDLEALVPELYHTTASSWVDLASLLHDLVSEGADALHVHRGCWLV